MQDDCAAAPSGFQPGPCRSELRRMGKRQRPPALFSDLVSETISLNKLPVKRRRRCEEYGSIAGVFDDLRGNAWSRFV
jgi:hypothetical protein